MIPSPLVGEGQGGGCAGLGRASNDIRTSERFPGLFAALSFAPLPTSRASIHDVGGDAMQVLLAQPRLLPGSRRLPKDNPIIIIQRNAKTLEIGNQITHDRVDISMIHGNTGQILRRDTTPHVDFVLT
jgi:hypothetical protein